MVPGAPALAGAILAEIPALQVPFVTPAINDMSAAVVAAWGQAESGVIISPLPVQGGSAPPGGPLVGGQVTLAVGSMSPTTTFAGAPAAFLPSALPPGSENQRALVTALAAALSAAWGTWVAGYSAQLVAVGGVAAWVPGPPPAPGPWTGGTNVPFPVVGGSSSGDVQMSPEALAAATLANLPPTIAVTGPTPGMISFVNAITKGFGTVWTAWKASTKISAGVGSGTAAPGGAITVGSLTSAKLL